MIRHGSVYSNVFDRLQDLYPSAIASFTRIHQIQGKAHRSPLEGQLVSRVPGVVTAVRDNGFYLQDPIEDGDDATSEGIFVFTDAAPTVQVGDVALVTGTVREFRPDEPDSGNLTVTQIADPTVRVLSNSDFFLPRATVIGSEGRQPPTEIIDNDAVEGNAENPETVFDPDEDGLDFYESLEGMLVQIDDAVAIAPSNRFGEVYVLPDNGENATIRTPRGGLVRRENDFNPERIQIDTSLTVPAPAINVGDRLAPITGVLDYSFGNFEVLTTSPLAVTSGNLTPEATFLTSSNNQLTVASYNVLALSPDDEEQIEAIAQQIVNNLKSPDILGLQEIEDNNGEIDDGVVDASESYTALIEAIVAAGGPRYEFRDVPPVDGEDGFPGTNFRPGFLFNPERVSFIDRPGDTSSEGTQVIDGVLSVSPGRIDPNNPAFENSIRPIVGEFEFNGDRLFIINHQAANLVGSDPEFGRFQPITLANVERRSAQAQVLNDWVDELIAADPDANVVVLGDLNAYQFLPSIDVLTGNVEGEESVLINLTETLPENERYTFNFQGNSQALDHILVSNNLVTDAEYDVVHLNTEFANSVSDHDPAIARLTFPEPTTLINGVASGDTTQTSTVLWTRSTVPGTVTFEYANDPTFATILGTETVEVTNPLTPVKVELEELTSGTQYFYRATDAAGSSAVGTFRTAAELGNYRGLRFGVSGDWQGELSPYPAIANADERNLDFFVQMGDTIEADSESPALPGVTQASTLEEFRVKHAEIYTERFGVNPWADLRASTTVYSTWDDHEITNDFAGGAAPADSPQRNEIFGTATEVFVNDTPVFDAALQAFQDYKPLRDEFYGETGDPRTANEQKLYRFNTFGSDAASFVLDVRSFRDAPLPFLPETASPEQVDQYLMDAFEGDRTMLGAAQLNEFKQDLLAAEAAGITWKFVMSTVPMQNFGIPVAGERWEGFAAERADLLQFIEENDIDNVVFITGDFHGTVVNNVTYQTGFGQPQISTDIVDVMIGPVGIQLTVPFLPAPFNETFAAPFGPATVGFTPPVLLEAQGKSQAEYLALSDRAEKDQFVREVVDTRLEPLGYDPIGLEDSGVDATLLQGEYIAAHTYGWSEFEIDAGTQKLTVTTYGVEPYTQAELEADPTAIISRTPEIVSQFELAPMGLNQVATDDLLDGGVRSEQTEIPRAKASELENVAGHFAYSSPLGSGAEHETRIEPSPLHPESSPFRFNSSESQLQSLPNLSTLAIG
jgi:predicted extracellular nuclease/phosphodiesterase/alkaline phosphatase D-like protein